MAAVRLSAAVGRFSVRLTRTAYPACSRPSSRKIYTTKPINGEFGLIILTS